MDVEDISRLKGNIVLVGVGNAMRGDDGAGPALIRELKAHMGGEHPRITMIDAGEVPENVLMDVVAREPDVIIFVDAADFHATPGTTRLIESCEIRADGFSTHNASLKLSMDFLHRETNSDILLLGIQPAHIRLGEGLSEPVKKAIENISNLLTENIINA